MNSNPLLGHIVTEDKVLYNHALTVHDGRIQSVSPAPHAAREAPLPYILPGFRDQHVHDRIGQSLAHNDDEDLIVKRFRQAMQSFARHGVVGVYAATFGDAAESLERYCCAARRWMDHAGNGRLGAKLLGVHIEGTFINEACRGAQPAEYCLIPDRRDCIRALHRFHETGAVKIINIVPDYGEASLKAIQCAAELGFLVGAGHTAASADQIRAAFQENDLKFMVHFTNGPTGQSFKPFGGGGAFEGALNLPIHKELIVDGVHVDDRYILDIIRQTEERWGLDKIVAVTDALFPSLEEIPSGEFTLGSTVAKLDPHRNFLRAVAYLQPDGARIPSPPNTLCSSVAAMDHVFSRLVTLFTKSTRGHWYDHPERPLDQALVRAARICATHQAKLCGAYPETGAIAAGKCADLVIGHLKNNDGLYQFHVQETVIDGIRIALE
ncbi:MAG: amidohydrolase family protein [Candidatus Omnitrophica bacterium]|nr:amidohydrolase family protein [Candidatus Omnitrophota bacterium]